MRKVSRKHIVWVVLLLAVAVVSLLVLQPWRGGGAEGGPGRTDGTSAHEMLVFDQDASEQPSEEASSSSVWTNEAPYDGEDAAFETTSEAAGSTHEATETESEERHFVMPEGASYEPEVALVTLSEGATVDEVKALLEQIGEVATKDVSEEDLARGYLELELVEGASVEETVNLLLTSDAIDIAQPNYCYYSQVGDEGDFRALLAEELAPASDTDTPGTADEIEEGAHDEVDVADESSADDVSDDPSETSDEESPSVDADPEMTTDPQPAEEELTEENEAPTTADAQEPADDDASLVLSASDLKNLLNDPSSMEGADNSWNLSSINAYAAWSIARCEGSVSVAIFDEHPSYEHEDLAGNVLAVYDATNKTETYPTSSFDKHGTHVAGIVGAVANNGKGVAGVSYNAKLVMVNVQNDSGDITSSSIQAGYTYIANRASELGVRIINLSACVAMDDPISPDAILAKCIRDAYEQGVITVVAAGNAPFKKSVKDSNGNTVTKTYSAPYYSLPGDTEQAVSVIGLTENEDETVTRTPSSNYNVAGQTGKNISAPGQSIYSTVESGGYAALTGTSMAAPHIAGVLALEFAANPNLTANEAVSVLYATAHDLGDEGWDEGYGYGEVDAWRAVTTAADPKAVAAIMGDEPYEPEAPEAPMPTVSGATRIPVDATADYVVSNGSLKLKSGSAAILSGKTLTGVKAGTVKLAVLDIAGVERKTITVQVYSLAGWWRISPSANAGLALNVKDGSVSNSANINLATASSARHQAWRFEEQEDGSRIIRNAKSGKLVHVANGSSSHGANVLQYPQNDTLWQQWSMEVDARNYITFMCDDNGLVLGVAGTAKNGANVQQQRATGAAGQKWQLKKVTIDVGPIWDGVYKVSSSLNTRYVLEVKRSSKKSDANVQLGKSAGKKSQKWLFTYLGKGVYKVTPLCSSKALTVKRGKKASGTNVVQGTWRKKAWQKWKVVANKDGSCSIRRSGTSLVLAAQGTKAKAGLNVCQAKYKSKAKSQKWWLRQY